MQPSPQSQPQPPEQPGASALQGSTGTSGAGAISGNLPGGLAGGAPGLAGGSSPFGSGVGRALGASSPLGSDLGLDQGLPGGGAFGSGSPMDGAVEASLRILRQSEDHDGPADPFGEIDESVAGDCQAMIARLYHFLDGELTDARRAKIMQHLEGCPSCFSAYDFEAELRIVVRERARTHIPPSLIGRIRLALESERDGC